MSETPHFSLAGLDDPHPVPMEPGILAANLAALRERNEPLAARIAATDLPATWQARFGIDDFPTWQVGGAWRCGTTAPWLRAESVAASAGTEQNLALASIGTGAELRRLLARLSPQNAAFVFEPDPLALRAVLALVDFQADLRTLRVILLDGPPATDLRRVLDQVPGLMPPQRIIAPAEVDAETVTRLRQACEQVGTQVLAARQQVLQDLREAAPGDESPPYRLSLLAIQPDARTARVAREFSRALTAEPAATASIHTGPPAAHLLDLALRIYPDRCRNLLTLGPLPAELPVPAGTRHVAWLLEEPGTLPEADCLAAGTPHLSRILARRAPDRARIDLWAAVDPPEEDPREVTRFVLCGDLPDMDEQRLGIVQPTHRLIWKAVLRQVTAAAAGRSLDAQAVLRQAERQAGVGLELSALRARMCEIIRRNLIPRVVLETIQGSLSETAAPWNCVGSGWPQDRRLGDSLCTLSESQWNERPLAIIFVGALAPPLQDLLWAAAHQWPILLVTSDQADATSVGPILEPDDLLAVPLTQLPAACARLQAEPKIARERAAAAGTRLFAAHTWRQRATQLLRDLSAAR